MTFDEAKLLVQPYIVKYEQYSVVSRTDAFNLLGQGLFNELKDHRTKGIAPIGCDGFYYWNVQEFVMRLKNA